MFWQVFVCPQRGSASGWASIQWGMHLRGVCIQRGMFCIQGALYPGGSASGGWVDPLPHTTPPPRRILRDTVNKRAVRNLLECILVNWRNAHFSRKFPVWFSTTININTDNILSKKKTQSSFYRVLQKNFFNCAKGILKKTWEMTFVVDFLVCTCSSQLWRNRRICWSGVLHYRMGCE